MRDNHDVSAPRLSRAPRVKVPGRVLASKLSFARNGPRSNTSWAVGVIAPWCLGVGVVVSFTASAGQDAVGGWNVAPLTTRLNSPTDAASLATALSGNLALAPDRPLVQLARLTEGAPLDLHMSPDEREPHIEIKPNATIFPRSTARTRATRPSPCAPPSKPGCAAAKQPARRAWPSVYSARRRKWRWAGVAPPGMIEPGETYAPSEAAQTTTTQKASAAALPAQAGSASTPTAPEARERADHGATPLVPRAVALASSTPAQPDAVPIQVGSFPA